MTDREAIVLIVDDQPENRRLYSATLLDLDCTLLTAASGAEALDLAAQHDLAAILLDVQMPEMDGFEVAKHLRAPERASAVPLLFISAVYTDLAAALKGYRIGAIDYLIPPIPAEILRAKVGAFVELWRARREAEAQAARLEQLHRELAVAYAGLEAFSHTAAHDLRAPLRRIAVMSEALLEGYGYLLDDDGRHMAGRIVANARDLHDLIERLLDLVRVTRTPLQRGTCDLTGMARDTARDLAAEAPQRKVVWDIAANLVAQAEPALARDLLANLIGNAWKFTAGTDAARIEVGRVVHAGETQFFVRDNGAGFDAAQAGGRLFEPFQRFHSSEAYTGSGIGLATVKRIVEKHGGRAWAESRPGQGATFWFTLAPPGSEG